MSCSRKPPRCSLSWIIGSSQSLHSVSFLHTQKTSLRRIVHKDGVPLHFVSFQPCQNPPLGLLAVHNPCTSFRFCIRKKLHSGGLFTGTSFASLTLAKIRCLIRHSKLSLTTTFLSREFLGQFTLKSRFDFSQPIQDIW